MNPKSTDQKGGLFSTEEKSERSDFPSRRDFIATAVGGAAALAALSCADDGGAEGGGTDSDAGGTGESDNPNDTGTSGPAPANRVVRVIDSSATSWDGQDATDFYLYANQDAVDAMTERGVMALTGKSTAEEAWRTLVPYADGELVLIHINAYANTMNNQKNNVAAPISAVVYGLVDVLGIPPENIAICDPSRRLLGSPAQQRIIDGCRYKDVLQWDLYRGEDGKVIPFTDGHSPPVEERLARVTEEADHIIMMPVLSWHGFNWITGALKMMMGSISDMAGLHSSGTDDWRDGAGLADVCMQVKDRVRLIVTDGLFGNISDNTGEPHLFETLGGANGAHPSSVLYFSKDMVATDSVLYDDLLDEARAEGSPKSGYRYGYLQFAADADHKLGTFEMRDETGAATYSRIDLVEVDLS